MTNEIKHTSKIEENGDNEYNSLKKQISYYQNRLLELGLNKIRVESYFERISKVLNISIFFEIFIVIVTLLVCHNDIILLLVLLTTLGIADLGMLKLKYDAKGNAHNINKLIGNYESIINKAKERLNELEDSNTKTNSHDNINSSEIIQEILREEPLTIKNDDVKVRKLEKK